MCIGIWTLAHPEYALILCTNRDEFLDRPTQTAHFHSFGKAGDGDQDEEDNENKNDGNGDILSGRDVQAGGTWFGINRSGRVALLTNITEPAAKKWNTSRGALVSSFLESGSPHPLEDEIGKTVRQDAQFAGFNLVLFAPSSSSSLSSSSSSSQQPPPSPSTSTPTASSELKYDALFITNHGGGGTLTSRPLDPSEISCGAISNGVDGAGAEMWPKVVHAKEEFERGVLERRLRGGGGSEEEEETEEELVKRLFDVLAWQSPEPITQRADLRKTVRVAPVPITLGGAAASPTPAYYGTRTSTVLLVKRKTGEVVFVERDVWCLGRGGKPVFRANLGAAEDEDGKAEERVFRFKINLDSSS